MTAYAYDKANRLLQAGDTCYRYDGAGNLVSTTTGDQGTSFRCNAAGKMAEAAFGDKTGVTYSHDAFGRKVRRSETAWVAQGNPNGTPRGPTLTAIRMKRPQRIRS